MMIDVATFVGTYPYRAVPDATADGLLRNLDRLHIDTAWVGHLAAPWHRDPRAVNLELVGELAAHAPRLVPIPTVHPALPGWEEDLRVAIDAGAPAVRVYPVHQALSLDGPAMQGFVEACAAQHLAVVLTVRFEDLRQRHPLDTAGDLPASAVRTLARLSAGGRLLVTHADRAMVEEVHFGLTPAEARRVLWDVSWIWGPPEDHLALLVRTVGETRFTLGTGQPLRIGEGALAKLDLLEQPERVIARITGGNLEEWLK